MAALDALRDKWDGITPRERTLVVLLGVSAVATIFLFLAFGISDRLDTMEANNARMRKALGVLEHYRVHGRDGSTAAANPAANIGSEPIKLESYLDKAAQKVGINVPSYKPRAGATKNGFAVHTIELQVAGLSLEQVRDFLEAIETDNPLVVTNHIVLKRAFNDKEKVDLKLEVSTFSRVAAEGAAAGGNGGGNGAGSGGLTPSGGGGATTPGKVN